MEVTEDAAAEAVVAAVVDVVVAVDAAEDSRYYAKDGAKIEEARNKETERRWIRRRSCALQQDGAWGMVRGPLRTPEKERLRFIWNGHRARNICSMHGVRQIWAYV